MRNNWTRARIYPAQVHSCSICAHVRKYGYGKPENETHQLFCSECDMVTEHKFIECFAVLPTIVEDFTKLPMKAPYFTGNLIRSPGGAAKWGAMR